MTLGDAQTLRHRIVRSNLTRKAQTALPPFDAA